MYDSKQLNWYVKKLPVQTLLNANRKLNVSLTRKKSYNIIKFSKEALPKNFESASPMASLVSFDAPTMPENKEKNKYNYNHGDEGG